LRQYIERLRLHLAAYPLVAERRVRHEVPPPKIPTTIKESTPQSLPLHD
jgi:hypothetical protein